ncbi:MAG: lipase family protein [Proteobacteria bacterium]|nr:lipase family protein [Pseudomonadota bacterium]
MPSQNDQGSPPIIPADLDARFAGATISNELISFMQLSGVAYEKTKELIRSAVADPSEVTPWAGGKWKVTWGPALGDGQANLIYVASLVTGANDWPIVTAVVVRGTDVDVNWEGLLTQLREDLTPEFQSPLPWLPIPSPVLIADGSLLGFHSVTRAKDADVTVLDYLKSVRTKYAAQPPRLVVTGHSLGGCIASVLAPYLDVMLNLTAPKVLTLPCTFAAPSAGNKAFAEYFEKRFAVSRRFFNTLDVIPCAWNELNRIPFIYLPKIETPALVDDFVVFFDLALDGKHYTQVATPAPLPGVFDSSTGDWYAEMGHQHNHETYIALMKSALFHGA